MEVRNDPPEHRVSSLARRYIHASFLRRYPQHAGRRNGRQYAGPVTISVTQSDAPNVTSAPTPVRGAPASMQNVLSAPSGQVATTTPLSSWAFFRWLLQLRVFRFGFLQDGSIFFRAIANRRFYCGSEDGFCAGSATDTRQALKAISITPTFLMSYTTCDGI
jgi:hypothetical protein